MYVKQNPRNKAIITCDAEEANGIISSDGTTIWHLEGLPVFEVGKQETVKAVEVCEDEFNSIRSEFDKGTETIEEGQTVREPLSSTEMMEKLDYLTNEVSELKEENKALKAELEALKS